MDKLANMFNLFGGANMSLNFSALNNINAKDLNRFNTGEAAEIPIDDSDAPAAAEAAEDAEEQHSPSQDALNISMFGQGNAGIEEDYAIDEDYAVDEDYAAEDE